MRIKKGDQVIITKGKDKGKAGKVLRVYPEKLTARVEGVNLVKKHMRRRSEQQPSGIVDMPLPVRLSNVALWCNNCKKGVRFSIQRAKDKSTIRACNKCKKPI